MSRPGERSTALTLLTCLVIGAAAVAAKAQVSYQSPPPRMKAVLEALRNPTLSLSPTRDKVLLIQRARYLDIGDLARPMLPLAGLRIDPNANCPARVTRILALTLKDMPSGRETRIEIPREAALWTAVWAPDGKHIAFPASLKDHTEIWVADTATGSSRPVVKNANACLIQSFEWMPDSTHLVAATVPVRGPAPSRVSLPAGPEVQESLGAKRAVRTFPDVLRDAQDDRLFDYYMTSQLRLVDSRSGHASPLGKPGVYRFDPSPDGKLLLVTEYLKPYSHRLPLGGFATRVAVWTLDGKPLTTIATLPNLEPVPLDGVPTGPRDVQWRADQPETLLWAEALDNGDPKAKVPFRDSLIQQDASRTDRHEWMRLKERFAAVLEMEQGGRGIVEEYDRDRERRRRYLVHLDASDAAPELMSDISTREQYANPGAPVLTALANGKSVVLQHGDSILLTGRGATPEGDRPFLDSYDLTTHHTTRLWRCEADHYEAVAGILSPDGGTFLTMRESPTEYPNAFLHQSGVDTPFTHWTNPFPELLAISKQLVTYQRSDGVECSFTLYLPPDYKPGERLPAIVSAYPLEFTDAALAGQVTGSTKTFPFLTGAQLFTLAGYAVLFNMTTPIVGGPETVNDTFVSQLVDDARAGIEKAAAMGVVDPARVGVMGHSYGAFMTANLLAHCDLFQAGAAESGAYNRTLTPFGFQSERRTYWQASQMYNAVSPFMFADKLKRPLLLIHGEQDDNPGTYTIQSERFYAALSGNGATARLVLLPYEAHGYTARQSVEHVMWEELQWFDRYVKGGPSTQSGRE